ncbi:MAG: hypothetical protein IJP48_09985 [Synergistaceae bacterium]|nr:hypothetical protein [Synergistaceae bacterium]
MKQMIAFHPGEGISNRVIKLILCIRHTADKSKPVLLNWDTTANSVVKEPFSKLFKFEYDCDLVETDIPINISEIWGTDYINCADTCIGRGGV